MQFLLFRKLHIIQRKKKTEIEKKFKMRVSFARNFYSTTYCITSTLFPQTTYIKEEFLQSDKSYLLYC